MRGWIMPEPLVTPASRTMPRRRVTSREAPFGCRSVVRMARATSGSPVSFRLSTSSGSFDEDQVLIQFDADHAGGSGQHLIGLQLQQLRQRFRGVRGDFVAGLRRAVCVACVDENRAANSF